MDQASAQLNVLLRYGLMVMVAVHGCIHLAGFAKAFGEDAVKSLRLPISKPAGMLWLLAALLFISAVVLLALKKEGWWMAALVAVLLSQVLIMLSWRDAAFGSILNAFILLPAVAAWGSSRFEHRFNRDVQQNFQTNNPADNAVVLAADLQHLPAPVQRYLTYAGVVGKPKVKNFHLVFEGEMREKGKDWFPFTSEQYNFLEEPARLFFMKGQMFGLIVPGYHHYQNARAVMDIRLFGWAPLVQKSGAVMDTTETVTFFNDLCLMAPATLIDKRIQWETIDDHTAKAVFTNHGIRISATLFFNEEGQLIDFQSNDRTAVADMQRYLFSTPCDAYKDYNGYRLSSEGEAVWHYPEGKFTYGKFHLRKIEYNVGH